MIDSRLQLLIAVSDYGTVTGAAEALYRSTSGVSRQLKQLEAEIDIALLEPDGRRVRLTEAGVRLVGHARALNAQWESALGDTAAAATSLCGPIRIGGFPTAITALLTPAVVALRQQLPLLEPVIKEVFSAEIPKALESGSIDVGIFVADESTSRMPAFVEVAGLMDDPIDLLVPQWHRLAGRSEVDLADTADEDWITGLPHQDAYREIAAATRAVGFVPRRAHIAQEFTATTALVGAGLGIAAVPRIAMRIPHPDVVHVPLGGEHRPVRRLLLAVRQGAQSNPRVAAAVAAIRAQVPAN